MIVLITGGREYTNTKELFKALDRLHSEREFTYLVHGDARGADQMSHRWAKSRGVQPVAMEALWDVKGRGAGPIRNQAMWDLFKPKLCVAFEGGRGTANMIKIAYAGGAEVIDVSDVDWESAHLISGRIK